MPDANDLSAFYNTPLNDTDEQAYQQWAAKNGGPGATYDYDMRGAWKSGAAQAENGHYPDTFKKPNHPTFSDQSQYHGQDGFEGGSWSKTDNGTWNFVASPSNFHWRSPTDLQDYFKQVEPNNVLDLSRYPMS